MYCFFNCIVQYLRLLYIFYIDFVSFLKIIINFASITLHNLLTKRFLYFMKHILNKRNITSLILLFFTISLQAQMSKLIRSGKDLSSSMINHIMQDSEGIIWISTDNGLNRQDGAKNTVLFEKQNNASRFEHTYEDSKGRIWICGSGRINLYDTNTGSLISIPAKDAKGELIVPSARGTIEDKEEKIYAYTQGNGIFELVESEKELYFRKASVKYPWAYVYAMEKDNNGIIWAGTSTGIIRWDGKNAINVTKNKLTKRIYDLCIDPYGTIWGASDLGGLYNYDPHTGKFVCVPGFENTPIISLLAKRKGFMLAGSNGYGIFEVNTKDYTYKQFSFPSSEVNPMSMNVHALCNDNNGNLWIGCYQKGIVLLRHQEDLFGHIGPRSYDKNIIGNSCVTAVEHDSFGNLWVGTDGEGIYAINGNTSTHFASHINNMPRTVVSLTADNRGRLWIGSWLEGLWVMDIATKRMTQVAIPSRDKSAASIFHVVDDGNGKMWIATMGNGVFSVDANTLEVKAAPMKANDGQNNPKENVIPNRWVNTICMGANGILYVGTFNGLGAINTKTGSCLSTFGGKNHLLPDQTVISLNYDSKGILWIGTGKGLMRLNTKDNSIRSFADNENLAGNCIQSITRDKNGVIWFSTNVGISSLSEKDNTFHNYYSGKGMLSNEFSKNAVTKKPDGTLIFGGTEGLTFFSPSNISGKHDKPNLLISALYINGQSVTPSTIIDGYSILDTEVAQADIIKLPFNSREFMLEFSSLNFFDPDNAIFEYSIDGGQWHDLPMTNNTVSFSSLSVGEHDIRVRAREWDTYSDIRELTVVIRSPWYFSWWAFLIYILVLGFIIYTFLRYQRERRKAAEAEQQIQQQEELSEARLQSFMNISHEIRTPMSLIISPLQRLMASDGDAKRQVSYQLMNRNAQRIQQLVNQLLDVRKIDKGQMKLYFRQVEMVSYVHKLVDSMHELCEIKNITLNFICQEEELKAWIDPMNFDKIIYNLLANAIKYSPEKSNISVTLATIDDKHYSIIVHDEGKGIAPDAIDHVFDRFFQQHNSTNNSVQGSGIGLNLTRSLTNMHHGDIQVANNTDGPGCHFTVTLPLGRKHIKDEEIDMADAETVKPEDTEDEAAHIVVTAEPEVAKRPKTKKRLLVVEDDDEILHYLKEELKTDFNVVTCSNGEEAMLEIRNRMPDIIISDLMMPVMDGLTLVKQIRQNTTMNELPFILLTAKTRDDDNIEGLNAGADAYITKPFNIEILRRTALNLVQRHDQLRNIYNGNQTPAVSKKVQVQSPDEKLMQRIIKVINDNISNPELGNELITREVGISRVHLYRKLKELTNLSLRDYIKNIRLTEAARLLSEQKHNIGSVALHTGFDNVSYFTVVFKQKYGMSPSAYMESQQKSKESDSETQDESQAQQE